MTAICQTKERMLSDGEVCCTPQQHALSDGHIALGASSRCCYWCYYFPFVLVLLTSLNCCMSTFCLVHYTLLLTPTCWKSNNTNAGLMAFAPFLAMDPTFGNHSHKAFDTAQPCHLLKPNWKPSSSHSISILISVPIFCYNRVCVCVVHFYKNIKIILYVNWFGRTVLYMCIEYHI